MSSQDAELFSKICDYLIIDHTSNDYFLPTYEYQNWPMAYYCFGLSFDDLHILVDLGLMRPLGITTTSIQLKGDYQCTYQTRKFKIIKTEKTVHKDVHLSAYFLSRAGIELYSLVSKNFYDVVEKIFEHGLKEEHFELQYLE